MVGTSNKSVPGMAIDLTTKIGIQPVNHGFHMGFHGI